MTGSKLRVWSPWVNERGLVQPVGAREWAIHAMLRSDWL
jgi:hypothetical protein